MKNSRVGFPSYARIPSLPSAGSVKPAGQALPAFSLIAPATPMALGLSCRSWQALTAVDQLGRLNDYADQKHHARPTGDELSSSVTTLNQWCSDHPLPTLATLGLSCAQWQVLTSTEKRARLTTAMTSTRTGFLGAEMPVLPSQDDVTVAMNNILAECLRQGIADAGHSASDAATLVRITVRGPAGTLPADIQAVLDGKPMSIVSRTSGTTGVQVRSNSGSTSTAFHPTVRDLSLPGPTLTILPGGAVRQTRAAGQARPDTVVFELRGVSGTGKTLYVFGTGIAPITQTLNAASGQTTSLDVTATSGQSSPPPTPTPEPQPDAQPDTETGQHNDTTGGNSGMLTICRPAPQFATEDERDAWILLNRGCPTPPRVGLSTKEKVGIGIGAIALIGGIGYAVYAFRKKK